MNPPESPTDGTVLLRALRLEDAAEHLAGQDIEQVRGFEFPAFARIEHVTLAIEQWHRDWAADGGPRNWGIWSADGAVLMGNVQVHWLADGRLNLSYAVFPDWRRRGVAARACVLALDYARNVMGAREATLRVLDGNVASIAVARSLGARVVGTEVSASGRTLLVFTLD